MLSVVSGRGDQIDQLYGKSIRMLEASYVEIHPRARKEKLKNN